MRTRVRVRGLDAACRMVGLGAGIAVVPEAAAQQGLERGALALIPLEDCWSERRLVVAVQRFDTLPSHAKRLVEHLVASA
jgi:DNA-binding transcriptional LysR family regulator